MRSQGLSLANAIYLKASAVLVIEGDVNGDKIADFQIAVHKLKLMASVDFVL